MKKVNFTIYKGLPITKLLFICFSFGLLLLSGCTSDNSFTGHKIEVEGVSNPNICLNGAWKFNMDPSEEFWRNNVIPDDWETIQVPGECAMQGFPIKHDIPYAYKTKIYIPSDYLDKIIKLKFEGIYSYARVWVNGEFIREHKGGFTAWECDITKFVQPGNEAWLTVEVTDKKNDISYGSGYAKHQIGGILKSVWLKALPNNYLEHLYFDTDLDDNYENANLNIHVKTSIVESAFIKFELFDIEGNNRLFNTDFFEIGNFERVISINVINPKKWDAEHPNLYILTTKLFDENKNLSFTKSQNIGFREVEVIGNKMMVNGEPIKLRGACRHDIHPTLGRTTTPEYDKKDVLLAKEANMNFIRTSHYPPSESFLNYCDQYGIYVEDESAVCFVNTHRYLGYEKLKQSGPEFEEQYLSQAKEMVHYHRNHPSIIIWSIGNESKYDIQLQKTYDYIKSIDTTRPVISSYPGLVPDSVKCYDILSMHYPEYTGNMGPQYGIGIKNFEFDKMPVLFDEWAHVACYNLPTLRSDPNVRDFWGRSLDSMWMNLYESEGGLGGAIWGFIDESFMLPLENKGLNDWWGIQEYRGGEEVYKGPTIGYGEWGIVDTWRRKKPEFWNTKKSYSPTKILIKNIKDYTPNADLEIPVYNRFDHTNFSELKIEWEYNSSFGFVESPSIAPHEKGNLLIPAAEWENGKYLKINFYNNQDEIIDKYNLLIGDRNVVEKNLENGDVELTKNNDLLVIKNNKYKVNLDLTSGSLKNLISGNDTLIKSGPHLNLSAFEKGDWATKPFKNRALNWKLVNTNYSSEKGIIHIETTGTYDDTIHAEYNIKLDKKGLCKIDYSVSGAPTDRFIRELGINFILGDKFTIMKWDRDSYWTSYPEVHLGMPKGEIELDEKYPLIYREYPKQIWEYDNKNFFYHGIDYESSLSNIALATKENIYSYILKSDFGSELEIISNGTQSCRLSKNDQDYVLYVNDQWDYASLQWGNFQKNIKFENKESGVVTLFIE